MQSFARIFIALLALLGLSACGDRQSPSTEPNLRKVIIQTDWFPQAEHGGFYQALAKGFYANAGLEVEILPGGPNSMSVQKVLRKRAHFAMNRADTIYGLAQRSVPITFVMATLQHDPQALLLHADNPISSFKELDGQRIMATPGLMWINWLQKKYDISLEIIPHDYGLERFLNDPAFIQQCLLTNEPFYAMQEGANIKVMPLNQSGFDPYHGIFCLTSLIEEDPDLVRDFVQASRKGWIDYITNDPQPAFDLIASLNPKMTPTFLQFSYDTMRKHQMIAPTDAPDKAGTFQTERLQSMVKELNNLNLIENTSSPANNPPWFTQTFTK